MSLEQPEQAAQEQANPYLPAGPQPLIHDQWMGLDTSGGRTGVPDEKCYWIDGFIRVGPRQLRTLWDVGSAIFTRTDSLTIVFFDFFNIGATPYCVVFMSDGSVVAVNTTTLAVTTILTVGSIINPSVLNQGITQWGQQYLIIVSNQTNGYWLWNGTTTFPAGGIGPTVIITNVGKAYKTPPTVIVSGGHGSGATFVSTVMNGQVTSITITNPGTGYIAGDAPVITLSGGTGVGSGASLTAVISNVPGGSGAVLTAHMTFQSGTSNSFYVSSITVTNGGSGYSQFARVSVTGGNPFSSEVGVNLTISGGIITAATPVPNFFTTGNEYSGATPPTITVVDDGGFYVSSVTGTPTGTGYSPSTTVTSSGGAGPVAQAAFSPVINSSGVITSVVVTSGGLYSSNSPLPTITISDTAVTATATVSLMPFAIQGTTVETYQGHVWIANGATYYWSAPGSFTDFATSDGGGNTTSADSVLRVNYSKFIQANAYLWAIGDSSVNYISGVQTTGTPPTTTFSNLNADTQTGTPFPASVESFGRDVLFANAFGVHVIRGGNVEKISHELDGVWNTVATLANGYNFGMQPSAAQATIFGSKKAIVVLAAIVDPVSGATVNKLFLYHEKEWFASQQSMTLTYVKHQEIQSQITTYGTDGITIKPLFAVPSAGFQKTVQTKLWEAPGGFLFKKAATRLWGLAKYDSVVSPNLTAIVDQQAPANSVTYTIVGPAATGYFVVPPQAVGQVGELTGMTWKTNAADASLVSIMLGEDVVGYRG
jgi:hypothetical protein